MITIEEAARELDGRQYGSKDPVELFERMKKAGLVAVFGASDDLMEFRGAIYDEAEVSGGRGTAYIGENGLMCNECDNEDCPYFANIKAGVKAGVITAEWCPKTVKTTWLISTALPHATFKILEHANSQDVFCIGLVFALSDCTKAEAQK